jgi:signal peptidase I
MEKSLPDREADSDREDGISLSAPVIMELIEAVHEKGASFRFQAKGHSMAPAIRDNDVITVSPLGNLMPRRGDVLAFRLPEQPRMLVHRVLHTKERKYYFKGDNCPEADGWIPAENVLGLITKVERRGRARFWPNRSAPSFVAEICLLFYPLWPPVRRIFARTWRRLRAIVRRPT